MRSIVYLISNFYIIYIGIYTLAHFLLSCCTMFVPFFFLLLRPPPPGPVGRSGPSSGERANLSRLSFFTNRFNNPNFYLHRSLLHLNEANGRAKR